MGVEDSIERLVDRDLKYEMTVHAEVNAVTTAALHGVSTNGATAYVTFHPCSRCAAVLINAGISTVVISQPTTSTAIGGSIASDSPHNY